MRRYKITAFVISFIMLMSVFAVNTSDVSAADKSTYLIKVNTQTNVVTIYKKNGKKYKPLKAMVCSSGGKLTPTGTFRLKQKIGWCKLVGNVWGQYSTVINGNYLFHSVPYSKQAKNKIIGKEYNKLGTSCSHGCIRLSVMDAKWIYEVCPQGTKVVIFRSKSKGPLGKPKPLKVSFKYGWDPTDPDSDNPSFRLPKPVIQISGKKKTTVKYGGSYKLKQYVTAKDPSTFMDLTSKIQIYSVKKYIGGKWKKIKKFSTKKVGRYKITYKVYYKYCKRSSYMNFKVRVTDDAAPVITTENDSKIIKQGDTVNLIEGVTAKQKSCSRTAAIKTTVLHMGGSDINVMNDQIVYDYKQAQSYIFSELGTYAVTYSVKNKYSPYRKAQKTIHITVMPGLDTTDSEE